MMLALRFIIAFLLLFQVHELIAQVFPNPAKLSTGQGTAGSVDPIWTVSSWYASNPPNPMGLTFGTALINNNCAPGSWVNPAALPPPVNNGNWITGAAANCGANYNDGYIYFRLTLNLPADCNGNSVATAGNYVLYFSGYADNTITDVFVNGTSTGINGGSYNSPLNITLTGPWVAGLNYVDVQVYNFPNGGNSNPYGLLLVANSTASANADGDGDGVADINDQCPCDAGTLSNGCLPAAIAGDSVICLGESTTLTASGGGSYLWSNGATTAAISVSPAADVKYTVVTTALNGYKDSAFVNVKVNALPNAIVTPAGIAICEGESTVLTASGGVVYNWSNAASTAMINVNPLVNTAYTVTVTNANGCSAIANSSVVVNSLPVASINPSSIAICNGANATLVASGGVSYVWSNAVSTATNSVSPSILTTYSVTVTDANNCTATSSSTVTVNALPLAAINPSTQSICIGDSATLTASGGTDYLWSNGEVNNSVIESPANTSSYSVTVTDANFCTAVASASVVVNLLPIVAVTPATSAICNGKSATLSASGGVGYLWSNAASTASINVSPDTFTVYSVTATDVNSCTATATSSITVNALPIALISPAGDTLCFGESTTLTASGGVAYVWNNATNSDVVTVSPTATTTYSVTVTDANNCTAATSVVVEVNPDVVLSVTVTDITCYGNNNGAISVGLSGGQTPYNFLWSNSAITQDLTALAVGSFSVTVTDNLGCTKAAFAAVNEPAELLLTSSFTNPTCVTNPNDGSISLSPSGGVPAYQIVWNNGVGGLNLTQLAPGNYAVTVIDVNGCTVTNSFSLAYIYDFAVQAMPAVSIKLGETAQLSYVLTGNAGSYETEWTPAQLLSCSNCSSPVTNTIESTLYKVEVKNSVGCRAEQDVMVEVVPDYGVFVPNMFSPNDDGVNDYFQIYGNVQALELMLLQVFNRSGEKVFETTDHNVFWDGFYNGAKADAGVYVWQLRLTFIDEHFEQIKKGSLTLLR